MSSDRSEKCDAPVMVLLFDFYRPYEKLAAIRGTARGRLTDLKCVAHRGETARPGISVLEHESQGHRAALVSAVVRVVPRGVAVSSFDVLREISRRT
jgi:hypothetical protein